MVPCPLYYIKRPCSTRGKSPSLELTTASKMSSPPPSVTLPPHGAPRIPQGMTFHAADASSTDVQEHAGVPAPWRDPAKSSFRFGGFEKRQPLTPDDMSSTLGLSELTSREPHYPDDSSAGVSAPTSQATTVNESSDKMERLEYFHPKAVQAVVDARRRFALHTSRNWRTETDLAYDIRVSPAPSWPWHRPLALGYCS